MTASAKKENIIKVLKAFSEREGRPPATKDFRVKGNLPFQTSTVERAFGSWNNALVEAGIIPSNSTPQPSRSVICQNCSKTFTKLVSQIMRTDKNFCGHSCAGIYQNAHGIRPGITRSKMEVYLERELRRLYPNQTIITNGKLDGLELDFYFPDIKLALEVNGITHYKPIYGEDKFIKIQQNDEKRAEICAMRGIELKILDISKSPNFTEKKALPFLQSACVSIALAICDKED